MTQFKELDPALPPEQRALADALRGLFDCLGLSLTRYAVRAHLDKSTLSRYLSGQKVPPWSVVHDLLLQSTKLRGNAAPTQEVMKHLKDLHHRALDAGKSPLHTVMLLQGQLAAADHEAERARMRECDLEAALYEARQRVAELTLREREIESERDDERGAHAAEIAIHQEDAEELRRQRADMLREIDRLNHELRTAHHRRVIAEQRCEALEQDIAAVEAEQEIATVSADPEDPLTAAVWLQRLSAAAAAKRLETMSPQSASLALTLMKPAAAGAIIAETPFYISASLLLEMPDDAFADLFGVLNPGRMAAALDLVPPSRAENTLGRMGEDLSMSVYARMRPEWLCNAFDPPLGVSFDIFNLMPAARIAAAFQCMDPAGVALILGRMPTLTAAAALQLSDTTWTALTLPRLTSDKAAEVLNAFSSDIASAVLGEMFFPEAAALLEAMESRHTAVVLGLLVPEVAVRCLSLIGFRQSSDALAAMNQEDAARLLQLMPPERAAAFAHLQRLEQQENREPP